MALPPNLTAGQQYSDNGIIYEIVTVNNAAGADYEVRLLGAETTPVMSYANLLLETDAEIVKVKDATRPNEQGLWEKYEALDGKIHYLKLTHQDEVVVA